MLTLDVTSTYGGLPPQTVYKTHLDLWFWQGDGPSRERPGYFMRLTSEQLELGAGMHAFTDAALRRSDIFGRYRPLQQWLVDLLPG
jgi:hypothetical protein